MQTALLCCWAALTLAAPDGNLVLNGDFEGKADAQGLPAPWLSYVPGHTAVMRVADDVKHEGLRSLFIQTDADIKASCVSDPIPVAPGERLSLSVWCRVDNLTSRVGGTLTFNAGFLDKEKRYFTWHKAQPSPAVEKEWFQLKTEAVVPARAAYVTFQVGVAQMTGKTWWDEAELRTESPLAARFDLETAQREPGEQTIPLTVLNRRPADAGRKVTIKTEPGGKSIEHTLTGKAQESIPAAFALKKRGKVTLKATLDDSANQAAFAAKVEVTVPPLLRVEPLLPTHFCIEDGTPKLEGRLWVHEEEQLRKTMTLHGSLLLKDEEIGKWEMESFPPNPIVFKQEIKSAPIGNYTIRISLQQGSKEVARAEQDWHIIRRSQAEVKLSDDGYPIVDGRKFFPLGIYNGGRFEEQGKAGFNVTHGYNAMATAPGVIPNNQMAKQFLDNSHANGMKTLMLVTHGSHSRAVNDETIRRIRIFRNHPGLLAWDEEEGVARGEAPLSFLKTLRNVLKKEAPEHPFMVGDCRDVVYNIKDRSELFPVELMDMGMWWWYPFPMTKGAKSDALQGEEATTGLELVPPTFLTQAKTTKPIWCGIQAYRKPERKDGRFPTPTEYRAQAYLAVIHGAKGLMYYVGSGSGGNGILNKPEEGNWEYLKSLATELRSMAPVFMSPDDKEAVTVAPADALLSVRLKNADGRRILLAASRSDQPIKAAMKIASLPAGDVTVRFENRTLTSSKGEFPDEFSPYAVHVYELPR